MTACVYGDEGHTSEAARAACEVCYPPPCEGDCCQRECDDCGWTLGPYDGDCPACGWREDPL